MPAETVEEQPLDSGTPESPLALSRFLKVIAVRAEDGSQHSDGSTVLALESEARMRSKTLLTGIALSIIASAVMIAAPATDRVVEAQTPAVGLGIVKDAPSSVLAGAPITYTLTASNSSAVPLFNLSFRDVLPLGVTYAGPTTPSEIGEPQIISNIVTEPTSGAPVTQQTLIWSNVSDLQARDDLSLTFPVSVNTSGLPARTDVHVIGAVIRNDAQTFASSEARFVPAFGPTGVPVPNPPAVQSATSSTANTTLTAIDVEKASSGTPEGELLRGVHNQVITHTITARVTSLGGTNDIVIRDIVPAALEFLGCGGIDNSTAAGGQRPEYPGAPLLTATPAVPGCVPPTRVETVSDPVLGGVTYPGVYTLVEWPVGDAVAGGLVTRPYAVGVPLFENRPFPTTVPTNGPQASNLDNNTGPSTRETATERSVTNTVRGEGNFTNSALLEPGTPSLVGDTASVTNTIEDIRIRKELVSPTNGVFLPGAEAQFRIVVQTSEYMDASGIVLTDTMPNGLCPMGNVAYPAPEVQCSVNRNPSPLFSSVTQLPGGGYRVVFAPIASLAANGTFTATYTAFMRNTYEGGSLNGQPTVSGDTFVNTVTSVGTTTGIAALRPPISTFPPGVADPLGGIGDASDETLTSTGPSIEKQLLPRDVSPRLNATTPVATRCPVPTGQYIDADSPVTDTPADVDARGFRLGDQICFRLRVDFSAQIRTRNAVVSDFIPPGTEYLTGSVRAAPANNTPFVESFDATAQVLSFAIGTPEAGNRFVNIGGIFDVVFAVEVRQVPAANDPLLTGNLMKMRTENSAGQAQSFRDLANFGIVPPPPISVVKGAASVNTPANGPNAANSNVDGRPVQQGSQVRFRIDLTNLGVPADFNNYSARRIEVLDLLPRQVTCSAVSAIENFGTLTNLGTCLNPGQSAGGYTNPAGSGRSVIRWGFDESDAYALVPAGGTQPSDATPGGTRSLFYTVTIPSPTSVSTQFDNDAGVRSYGGFTNLEGVTSPSFIPANNIDAALRPQANAPAANDTSWVRTPDAVVEKFVTTWIQETNNNTSDALPTPTTALPVVGTTGQAVIGEFVTYRYYVDIPAQTTVFAGALTDPMPTSLTLVPSPPTPIPGSSLTFFPNAASSTPGALPAGVTLDSATGAVTFGSTYNNSSTTAQRFEVIVSARVTTTGLTSVIDQPTRSNTARFVSTATPTGPALTDVTDFADVQIRQPTPIVGKSVLPTTAAGGDVVTFTLTASAEAGRPPLHDAWLVDCVPAGLGTVTVVGSPTPVIGPLTGIDAVSRGCSSGQTYLAFGFGTLQPGAPAVTRQFTAVVSPASVGGQRYANTVTLSGSSLATGNAAPGADDPNERVYTATAPATVTVRAASLTKAVAPSTATVGQLVQYTLTATAFRNVNYFQAAVRDALPAGIDRTTVAFLDASCNSVPNASVPTPPGCSVSPTILGPTAQPSGSLLAFLIGDLSAVNYDRVYTIRYTARLANIPANIAGSNVANTARVVWDATDLPTTPTTPTYPWTNQGNQAQATVRLLEPSLSVIKGVSDSTPDPGQAFTYTLTLLNSSGADRSPAYNVTLVDTVPAGVLIDPASISPTPTSVTLPTATAPGTITWGPTALPGPIAPGASVALSYQATLAPSGSITAAPKTNTADITRYEGLPAGEPAGANRRIYDGNSAQATVIPQFPVLVVDKTVESAAPAYIGTPVTWRIRVTNTGTSEARSVDIADTLPAGWTYDAGSTSITRPAGPPLATDPTVTGGSPQSLAWDDVGTLLPTQFFELTFRATPTSAVLSVPPTPFPGGSRLQVNNAAAAAVDTSGETGNLTGPYADSDDVSTRIDSADVRVVKTNVASPATAGAEHSWSVVVSNAGPDTAVGPFTVVDTLPTLTPTPLTFVSATGTGWTCSQNTGTVTCNRTDPAATLASGASFQAINVVVRTPAEFLGTMTNAVTVGARTHDPDTTNNNSSVDVPVVGQADLSIVKTRTEATIVAGRTVTYNLAVTNNGPSTSRETITVVDTLPAGTTFVSAPTAAAGDPWNCVFASGVVTCTLLRGAARAPLGDLLAGTSAPNIAITIGVPANIGLPATLTNTATVNAGATTDPIPGNNTSTNAGIVEAVADLVIDKAATGTLVAGQQATYRLRIDNLGPSDAAAPRITDSLPAGLDYIGFSSVQPASGPGAWSCTSGAGATSFTCDLGGPLAAGTFAIVDVRVAVAPTVTGTILNTATVSSTTPDPNLGNNTDTDGSPFDTEADLQLIKTGPTAPVRAGTSFTWTLQVTNLGPSVSRQPITVTDTLPAGVVYRASGGTGWSCTNAPSTVAGVASVVTCTLSSDVGFPAPGNTAPLLTIDVDVPVGAGPATVVNTAVVAATTRDPNSANNGSQHSVTVVDDADLRVLKTPESQTVRAGEVATFTLQVDNLGPSTADNVVLTDTLPSGMTFVLPITAPSPWDCSASTSVLLTCTLASLAPGSAPSITVRATVGSGVTATTLVNRTGVSSSTPDPVTGNNTDTADVVVTVSADLTVTKSHPAGPVRAGDDLVFTLSVSNAGPSDATAVTLLDTLPPGFTFVSATSPWTCVPRVAAPRQLDCTSVPGTLAAGASTTFDMTVAIAPDVVAGRYDNVAEVSSPDDTNLGNNRATDQVDLTTLVSLTVTKTHDPASVAVGRDVVFTLTVLNGGPSAAQDVRVTDAIPTGLTLVSVVGSAAASTWDCSASAAPNVDCRLSGSLGPDSSSETVLVTASVLPSAYPGVINVAAVTTTTPEDNPNDNTATDAVVVPPLVDLAITKTHADPVAVGGNITYTIIVTNEGPTADPGPVVISDVLPDALRPVTATATGAACGIVFQTVTCATSTPLAVAGTITVTIVATVLPTAYPSVTNSAVVATPSTETDLTNNSATDTATVTPLVRLQVVKTLGELTPGTATWSMVVTNLGPNATIAPIVLVDQLPPTMQFVSVTGEGWVCVESAGRVQCSYAATLTSGASAPPVMLRTDVVAPPGTELVNTVTVSGGGPDVPTVSDDAGAVVPPPLPATGGAVGRVIELALMLLLAGALFRFVSRNRRRYAAA